MLRRDVIPSLGIDEDIALCHFYDRIWTLRTIEAGWHVGVLGIEIDHRGGITSTGNDYNQTAIDWCQSRGIAVENNNGDLAMYLEAERRYLTEYREGKHMIPCQINSSYDIDYYHLTTEVYRSDRAFSSLGDASGTQRVSAVYDSVLRNIYLQSISFSLVHHDLPALAGTKPYARTLGVCG